MKYKQGTRRKPIEYEKDLVNYWQKNKIFEESVNFRPKDNSYVFYDGPPFITGVPHHGTLLSGIVKDAVPRYWTMKGKRIERVWGWDCHGLPAERYTEQKLGLNSRQDVIDYGIEKFIVNCRENMVQTAGLWEQVVDRSGRWVDMKHAYRTMDKDYMESVWWAFKELYKKGKIYEGEKVLMYCTLDATPLSKAEVTMDAGAYQDVTDPSVYAKFELTPESIEQLKTLSGIPLGGKNPKLLVWTTTPWTLLANTALAINKNLIYLLVECNGDVLIVEENLVKDIFVDERHQPLEVDVIGAIEAKWLSGMEYRPLFGDSRGKNAHKIWHADYVSNEDGTGIVHIAPAYGEEDFELAQKYNIPVVHTIDENGNFTEGDWKGKNVWDINKQIAKDLKERGIVWKIDYIKHSYPHCHRCGTRLMYRAHPSWFMDIDGQRELMLEQNGSINWFPPRVKEGRFAKNIEQAPDWNLSRDRFWATAMPVWKGTDKNGKEHIHIVGSYAELKELSGIELEDYHRPWIDDVTFEIDGVKYHRIDKVMDCWFESGSMPFAQFHYPFENVEKFEENFPGDFIVEYVGQVRAWFYYVHAVNVGLFGHNAYKNVIVTGNVAGNDGRKMSKSFNNFTDPNLLMDEYSADALRFLLLSSPLLNGEDYSLIDKNVADTYRKLNMVWNMFEFFTMYADVDNWEWGGSLDDPYEELDNVLDKWIISRVHQLLESIDSNMQRYDIPCATKDILPFIDDASNWYIRRSRKRFWKSDNDQDKNNAYKTLHYVLVKLSLALAPFTPFMAEELFIKLTNDKSVHLQDWPKVGHINELLVEEMASIREIITLGLNQRAANGIKVRQPLQSVTINTEKELSEDLIGIIADELNVKKVMLFNSGEKVVIDTTITESLMLEGYSREVIRQVQESRKKAGLNISDRIKLKLDSKDEILNKAIKKYYDVICQEALVLPGEVPDFQYQANVKVSDAKLNILINKA